MSDLPDTTGAGVEAAAVPPGVAHPNLYVWYLLVGSLDLMLTNFVITHFGAREVNGVAAKMLELFGFWGLIALKFATVGVVIGICEYLAPRRPALSRRIAEWAVAISAVPVVVALVQVVAHRH